MNLKHLIVAASLSAITFSACNEKKADSSEFSSLPAGKKFIDPSNIDTTVNPADDFYQYANGAWMKTTEIPASETRWGSFNLLEEFNKKALQGLLEDAALVTDAEKGTPIQMVGDMYRSGMDTNAINKAGISAIQSELDKINALTDANSLINEIARQTTINAPFAY